MRLIDADELKKSLSQRQWHIDDIEEVMKIIDNAPTVEEKPQSKWFNFIDKGLLKARHGYYVLYKVDYLLDNLTREIYNMEDVRRMRGKDNDKQ